MMAMSSCANGRNNSEKNCTSHDESWSKKFSKADSAFGHSTLGRISPTGAVHRHPWAAYKATAPRFGGIVIGLRSLPLEARAIARCPAFRINFL
jgi:hypothetical protein